MVEMSDAEFKELVRELRKAQKEFFKAAPFTPQRSKWLEYSKELERKIDKELEPQKEIPF